MEALEDRTPRPRAVWNRIPERIRAQVIETALAGCGKTPCAACHPMVHA